MNRLQRANEILGTSYESNMELRKDLVKEEFFNIMYSPYIPYTILNERVLNGSLDQHYLGKEFEFAKEVLIDTGALNLKGLTLMRSNGVISSAFRHIHCVHLLPIVKGNLKTTPTSLEGIKSLLEKHDNIFYKITPYIKENIITDRANEIIKNMVGREINIKTLEGTVKLTLTEDYAIKFLMWLVQIMSGETNPYGQEFISAEKNLLIRKHITSTLIYHKNKNKMLSDRYCSDVESIFEDTIHCMNICRTKLTVEDAEKMKDKIYSIKVKLISDLLLSLDEENYLKFDHTIYLLQKIVFSDKLIDL